MVKTEQHYKEQIAKEIRRIAELEHNKEAADKFWKTLEKIKPKSCKVKSILSPARQPLFTIHDFGFIFSKVFQNLSAASLLCSNSAILRISLAICSL